MTWHELTKAQQAAVRAVAFGRDTDDDESLELCESLGLVRTSDDGDWSWTTDGDSVSDSASSIEEGRREAEETIVAMLKREDAKCSEYLSTGQDQDKREQQGHYSDSMVWTIDAIECGDHWSQSQESP